MVFCKHDDVSFYLVDIDTKRNVEFREPKTTTEKMLNDPPQPEITTRKINHFTVIMIRIIC